MSLRSPPEDFMKTLCLTPLSSSYLTVTLETQTTAKALYSWHPLPFLATFPLQP